MGDVGETWSAYRDYMREKKKNNYENSRGILDELGINYKVLNNGVHIIINANDKHDDFDFWPSTGKFINRKTGKSGRGVHNLLSLIREKQ